MRHLFLFFLFPALAFSQNNNQKIASVFKDLTIEVDNNLYSQKQNLNILNIDTTDKDIQLNKDFYYTKSDFNPFNYRFEQKPLHRNPMHYHNDYEYQMMGGSQGIFYTNLIGGLIESVFGELTFKL